MDSLANHIKRANYQAHIWKKSLCNLQNLPSPETNGWSIQEQDLKPTLMSKDPATSKYLRADNLQVQTFSVQKRQTGASAGQTAYPAREAC